MKSPVAASQPAHRPTGNISMARGVSSRSLMLLWGELFVAELLHILFWSDTATPVTGAGAGGGSRAHGPSLSAPCCKQGAATEQGTSMGCAEAMEAALLPQMLPKAGGTLPWPCPISPPAPSLTGVPAPEPLPRTQLDPSPQINPGTAQRRHLHLGLGFPRLCFPRSQNGLLCLNVYPRSSLHTLPLPSFLQLPQHQASTRQQPWLSTAAHTPLNAAHYRLVRSPPKHLLQLHLLLSAHGKDTPGTGKTLQGPGAWGMLLSRGISAKQKEAAMSLLGDGYQQQLGQVLCHTQVSS